MGTTSSLITVKVVVYLLILMVLSLLGCDSDIPAGNQLWVTVAGDNEVVVINEESAEVVANIRVGSGPAVAIKTPDDGKVYTANWGDRSISAIDTSTHSVTNISLTSRPLYHRDGSRWRLCLRRALLGSNRCDQYEHRSR